MLCKSLLLIFGVVALAAGETQLVEDQFGAEYLMVPIPLNRLKRQTTVDINKNPVGTQVLLGHKGTIFQNDRHLVTGEGFASKNFHPNGPTTVGGSLGYEHLPSGSGINLSGANTRGFGTDFSAKATANIWKHGNTRLDAYGNYDRHYGGPMGTGRADYGGGLQFEHRFP